MGGTSLGRLAVGDLAADIAVFTIGPQTA